MKSGYEGYINCAELRAAGVYSAQQMYTGHVYLIQKAPEN